MAAVASAPLGDAGRGDDPTVAKLERLAAELTGKRQALFLPSGTMANLAAVMAHDCRGGEAIVEGTAHIYNSEGGGLAVVAGSVPAPAQGPLWRARSRRCEGGHSLSVGPGAGADEAHLPRDHPQRLGRLCGPAGKHGRDPRRRPDGRASGAPRRRTTAQRRRPSRPADCRDMQARGFGLVRALQRAGWTGRCHPRRRRRIHGEGAARSEAPRWHHAAGRPDRGACDRRTAGPISGNPARSRSGAEAGSRTCRHRSEPRRGRPRPDQYRQLLCRPARGRRRGNQCTH